MVRVIMIVDETGSMLANKAVTISSYNEWLDSQREIANDDEEELPTFTCVKFNINSRIQEYKIITDAPVLTEKDYNPSSMTALYDAIGDTLVQYKDELDNICVIITDGQENSSRRFNQKKVFEMITKYTEEKCWVFHYLGANQNAFAVGQSLGIAHNKGYKATTEGFKNIYAEMQEDTKATRGWQGYQRKHKNMAVQRQVVIDEIRQQGGSNMDEQLTEALENDLSAPPPEYKNFEEYRMKKGGFKE